VKNINAPMLAGVGEELKYCSMGAVSTVVQTLKITSLAPPPPPKKKITKHSLSPGSARR